MKSENKAYIAVQVHQLVDAAIVVMAFFVAILLWSTVGVELAKATGWFRIDGANVSSIGTMAPVLYLMVPFIPLTSELFGFYRRYGSKSRWSSFRRCLNSHITVGVCFTIIALVLKLSPHRPTLLIGMILSLVLMVIRERLYAIFQKKRLARGVGQTRLLIAGQKNIATEWWEKLGKDEKISYKLMGYYSVQDQSIEELTQLLSETAAERVVFLVSEVAFEKVTKAVEECEIQGVEVWLAADFVRSRICQPTFDSFGNTPMLVLRSTPALSWSLLAKDILDRVGALFLIIVTSPFWLLAYIGIKIQSPGPAIYRQERAGKYGHPFKIWKFRTMIMDADKKLEELKKEQGNQMSGPVFKLDHDPRIFSFGQFMRKFSIDELPQLVNVLKGEMSLVGPRPMAMYELPDIEKSEHRRKLSVKPGITCIWQVTGRNEITDFDDWVKLDLQYIDNWSFWLDIKLLLMTLPAVLFAKGSK